MTNLNFIEGYFKDFYALIQDTPKISQYGDTTKKKIKERLAVIKKKIPE